MKLRNPIKEHRERKEAERRRKEAERKKQQKRTLIACAGILAAIFVICGIGAMTEKNNPDISEPSTQVEVSADADETSTVADETDSTEIEPEQTEELEETSTPEPTAPAVDLSSIPTFSGSPYVEVNGNVPYFSDDELTTSSFESYSSLDSLGRCGIAYACISTDLMPTEERGSIGQVKPSGWHTVKYNGVVDGNYLYNRCHLIGYQLTGENANTQNLITGTRYMNTEGMLPFENMVADYIKETGNHVLYRVTPIFDGNNLVASGVLMEAKSVEDSGDGILFNVYCYNAQPNITIDYATGDSSLNEGATTEEQTQESTTQPATTTEQETTAPVNNETTYILNTNTMKFHYPSCSSVNQMSDKNKQEFTGTRDEAISKGYSPCGRCNP